MMTVHDHIEGALGRGPIRGAESLRWGNWELGGARGKIRAGSVLFRLGLRCAALSLD